MKELTRILEALLFVADGPLSREQMQETVPEAGPEEIEEALEELRALYEAEGRGIGLYSVGNGHQVLTRPEVSSPIERFLAGRRRQRLSRAALEVLSIVAYRQPITRGEIETVRGVDCGATLHTLLERRLITIKGRARTVGHPLLYVTTPVFLEHFGLAELKDLPRLDEFAALVDRDAAREELRQAGLLAHGTAESPSPNGDREIHAPAGPEAEAGDEAPCEGEFPDEEERAREADSARDRDCDRGWDTIEEPVSEECFAPAGAAAPILEEDASPVAEEAGFGASWGGPPDGPQG